MSRRTAPVHPARLALTALGLLCPALAPAALPPSAHDDHWLSTGPAPELDGQVVAATAFEGDLVAGGYFAVAGPVPLNHIGRWDGSAWHALGSGLNGPVTRLCPFQDGLAASGAFTVAGVDSAENVALWRDGAWSPLGKGFTSAPAAFAVYNDRLVAGGYFWRSQDFEIDRYGHRLHPAANRICAATWTGSEWEPMGTLGDNTALSSPVRDLVVYRGDLLAAGWIRDGGNYGMARWDGTRWNPCGPVLDGTNHRHTGFNAFTVYNGLLVAGGIFDRGTYQGGRPPGAVEVVANNVMTFDGATWAPLGEGLDGGVLTLAVQNEVLVAAGTFTRSGTRPLNHAAWWDETTRSWQPLGAGTDGMVRTLAPVGDALFAGGRFLEAGGVESPYLATWKNQAWTAFPSRPAFIIEPVHSLLDYRGSLVGYGNGLLVWKDGEWSVLSGFHANHELSTSYRLNTDWGDHYDLRIGLDPAGRVISPYRSWDGSIESPATPPGNTGLVMTTFEGRLVAGGGTYAGGSMVEVLDGSSWQRMAAGLVDPGWGRVRALRVVDGRLFAAGLFDVDDGPGSGNLAVWSGSRWTAFAPGTNNLVEDLAVYQGDLVAAGWFTEAGGVAAAHIARWDGTAWHPLGAGLDGPVHDLAVYDGRLIAGGRFQRAGAWTAPNVAAWDGTGWSPLGSGADGEVYALAEHAGDLFLGGRFIAAGGRTSIHFARWRDGSPIPRFTELDAVRTAGGARIRWNAEAVPGDFRGFAILREAFGKEPERITADILDPSDEYLDRNAPAGPVTYRMATLVYSGKVSPVAAVTVAAEAGLALRLGPTRPNPFQGSTRISFASGFEGPVRLAVIAVTGRVVTTLVDRTLPPGEFEAVWDGSDAAGRRAAAGLYFFRLTTPEGTRVVKMQKLQ